MTHTWPTIASLVHLNVGLLVSTTVNVSEDTPWVTVSSASTIQRVFRTSLRRGLVSIQPCSLLIRNTSACEATLSAPVERVSSYHGETTHVAGITHQSAASMKVGREIYQCGYDRERGGIKGRYFRHGDLVKDFTG